MEKITFSVDKSYIESIVARTFTNDQWEAIADEMEDLLDYYFYDELPRVIAELDIVE